MTAPDLAHDLLAVNTLWKKFSPLSTRSTQEIDKVVPLALPRHPQSDTSSLRVLQMRGGDPLLHLGVDNWLPLKWTYLGDGHDTRVGLAFPLLEPALPWYGRFWEAA